MFAPSTCELAPGPAGAVVDVEVGAGVVGGKVVVADAAGWWPDAP
jgi:hypothetical protein